MRLQRSKKRPAYLGLPDQSDTMTGQTGSRSRLLRRLVSATLLLIASAYLLSDFLLARLGQFLIASQPPVKVDAIVVLSGSLPDRILEGVKLYHDDWADRIILTRGNPSPGIQKVRELGAELPDRHQLNVSVANST